MSETYYGPGSELSPSDVFVPPVVSAADLAESRAATEKLYSTPGALGPDDSFIGANDPVGNTSQNYVEPKSYTVDASGNKTTSPIDFSGIQKLITDNRGLLTAGGAALGLMGGNDQKYGKTGYQGTIPELTATRQMLTAPPTTNPDGTPRRPGSGGINYGGDVTYTRTPGQDPWMNLSGTNNSGKGINNLPGAKPAAPAAPANLGSKGYQAFIAAGKTPAEYLSAINQWIIDNPNASQADIAAAMKKFDVTQEDLQAALTSSDFSDATKYFMTHGEGGIKELNNNIIKWIQDNPNASKQEIADIIKASGVDTRDLGRAFGTEDKLSKAKEYALTHGMSLDYFNDIINNYMGTKPKAEDAQKFLDTYGITDADVQEAAKYTAPPAAGVKAEEPSVSDVQNWLKTNQGASDEEIARAMKTFNVDDDLMAAATGLTPEQVAARRTAVGFAEGGMAKGRYLQGATDGMADELPARIGANQPAALSHGEFVIPADVVSHMGNGNSDAGAKKLYQMMDKIRMARTGTKKQGKQINPDKFMPGGLAKAYAGGGAVKHFLTGGSTSVPSNTTGVESNLSNWAGSYVTNMLGQGQALANSPYQAYTGPLTAGASPLQEQAFKGLAGLKTPSSIGEAAATAGDYAKRAGTMSYTPQTMDFLGNANRSGLTTTPDKVEAHVMPARTGADYTSDLGFFAMPAKTAADRAGTAPTGPLSGIGGLLQGMGAANAQPAPPVDEAGRPVAMGADGRPIRPNEAGGMMQPQVMPQQGSMQSFQASQQPNIAQQYMNPYLQAALNPQLDEARRQAQITQQGNAAKMVGAGAFGGSRQALMDTETQRNLGQNLASITGKGYETAYDKAMAQFNADQQRKMQEGQFGATYGLDALKTGISGAQTQGTLGTQQNQADINTINAQLSGGNIDRGITSEGIAADKAQFEEARANPYKMVQFQQSLLSGLPLAAQSYNVADQSSLQKLAGGATTVADLIDILSGKTAAKKAP